MQEQSCHAALPLPPRQTRVAPSSWLFNGWGRTFLAAPRCGLGETVVSETPRKRSDTNHRFNPIYQVGLRFTAEL